MCLDADSYIDKNAIKNAVKYFSDSKVVAMASNVRVKRTKGILNLAQVYEYIVCYQMKRAHTSFNIEYIVGGIGSVFRKDFMEKINYYDANTVTEDIDITMKILREGNKKVKLAFGSDVIAYTQGAQTLQDLFKQRYRWKWGRYQTFYKNKSMFFSHDKKFTKGLTFVYLPFALWSDIAFFFEPFIVLFILFLVLFYHDFYTFLSAFLIMSFFIAINILDEDTFSKKIKLQLLIWVPSMYFLFYILSVIEYMALIRSWIEMPKLKKSLDIHINVWKPIKRLRLDHS